MKVAVIGLGRIGGGVARGLDRHGHEVSGYDVNVGAVARLAGIARSSPSPRAAAAGAGAVLVAVYDDAQVREVLSGPESVLAAEPPPQAVVILSTVSLDTVEWAGQEAQRAGVALFDCGVTGGRAIEEGEMAAMVGGDEALFESIRPTIEAWASLVVHMGPLGSGMRAKLARNMIVFGCWYVASEAARLAAASGIDVEKLVEVSNAGDRWSGGPMGLIGNYGVGPDPPDPRDEEAIRFRRGFANYAHKDLGAALELAERLGVELPATKLVRERFPKAVGLGD